MILSDTGWDLLEQWSPIAFLAAGGLFTLPEVASGLQAVTGTEIAVSPAAIFVFMLVVFIGLLGLYPRLAEHDSTLAKGGVGLLALTTVTILPAIGVFVPSTGLAVGEATALAIVVSVAVGSTLTATTFGIASLRTGAHSRHVGRFLLVMAAAMSFMIVALLVYAHSTPVWVSPVANGLVATSLGSIGYVLRTADVPSETPDSIGDVTPN
jgi:hypothetical protein